MSFQDMLDMPWSTASSSALPWPGDSPSTRRLSEIFLAGA